jgi:ankyrin repeat protein
MPLCQAVRQGDEAMVRLLLECDADVTEPNNVGLTALDWAKISESKSILQLLLDAIAAKKEREQKASSSSSSLSSSPHLIHRTLNDKQSKAASGNSPKVEQKESLRIGNA